MKRPAKISPLFYDPAVHYERQRVRLILTRLGLMDGRRLSAGEDLKIGRSILQLKKLAGRGAVGFAEFQQLYPGFPILLRSRLMSAANGELGGRTMPEQFQSLLVHPAKSRIITAFHQLRKELEPERARRPIGMIFPGAKAAGGLILHDAKAPFTDRGVDIRIGQEVLHLEHFSRVLDQIAASDWKPDQQPDGVQEEFGRSDFDAGRQIPAWIVSRYGSDARSHVLDLLCQLFHRRLQGDQPGCIQRRGHERVAVITQKELATLTRVRRPGGYGLRAIQKALRQLERDGAIELVAGFSGQGNIRGYRLSASTESLAQEQGVSIERVQTGAMP